MNHMKAILKSEHGSTEYVVDLGLINEKDSIRMGDRLFVFREALTPGIAMFSEVKNSVDLQPLVQNGIRYLAPCAPTMRQPQSSQPWMQGTGAICHYPDIGQVKVTAPVDDATTVVGKAWLKRRLDDLQSLQESNAKLREERNSIALMNSELQDKLSRANESLKVYAVELESVRSRLSNSIELTKPEIQSGLDRVKWAEALIRQLPGNHDGRNSWLFNYADKSKGLDIQRGARTVCTLSHVPKDVPVSIRVSGPVASGKTIIMNRIVAMFEEAGNFSMVREEYTRAEKLIVNRTDISAAGPKELPELPEFPQINMQHDKEGYVAVELDKRQDSFGNEMVTVVGKHPYYRRTANEAYADAQDWAKYQGKRLAKRCKPRKST